MKKLGIWIAFALTVAANFLWVYREQLPPAETLWAMGGVIVRPVALPPDPQVGDPTYLGGWQGYDLFLPKAKAPGFGAARFELVERGTPKADRVIATNDIQFYRSDRLRIRFRLRQPELDTVAALRKAYPRLPRPEAALCLLDLYVSGSPGAYSRQTHLLKLGKPTGNQPAYTISNFDRKNRVRVVGLEETVPLHEFSLGLNNARGEQRTFSLRVRWLGRGEYRGSNVFSGVTL